MNRPAARLGDATQHGSPLIGVCATTVLVKGMPAWRITDVHNCLIPNAPPPAGDGMPHGPGVTMPTGHGGAGITLIEGKPAACQGDIVFEAHAVSPPMTTNKIIRGEPTVLIGQR